jgi:serine/threonine-protein kinase
MELERWKLVDDLLQSALELPPGRREEFLRAACAGDSTLAEEVRSLLTSHRRAGEFLESPAVEVAARAIASSPHPPQSQPFSASPSDSLPDSVTGSLAGQIISHYRLLKMIGRGGMGSVWLAERCDGRFERKVAIKFIHLAVLDSASAERFKREGEILGKLVHPQIAELVDAGLTSMGEPYLVLEYIEGRPIDEYADAHTLGLEDRIRLFLDVLSAVAHAHRNLIVHRDIKPSNVFVSDSGQVKLLDFGIAKVLAEEAGVNAETMLTLEAGAMLTPRYAAPEQVSQGAITTATDIYSLGVLLYVLLTGQHPAGPGPYSMAQLIKTIVDEDPPFASDAASTINEKDAASRATAPEKLSRLLRGDLDRILAKAVRKNPAERYASAAEFADDLQRFLDHKPVLARPDSFAYRTAKFVRRHRVGVGVATILFLTIAAAVTGLVIQDRRLRTERDFALRQLLRLQQHDEFLDFLLSDAAPSGKPFTVNNLLDRATRILEKQKPSLDQAELFEWIGIDYSSQDQHGSARPLLERAYAISRQSSDPSERAKASCALGVGLARDEDLKRAEDLIQQGLRELPDDPQYAYVRIDCLRQGGEVSRQRGEASEAVHRIELARQIARQSPFNSDKVEMTAALDLASMYSEAGRDRESLAEFERASGLMTALGRDETETAVVLYNNWAVELDQIGRPLEAEKVYRRVIDISRDGDTEEAVSPMVLTNYARVQRELNHLPQAQDYVERAYNKALKTGDELVINQSLLERSRVCLAQDNLPCAESMLDQVEPRLHKLLPPGHYAFGALASSRGAIAFARHDLPTALRLTDQGISTIETAVKAGHEGAFVLPDMYTARSKIELALGHADQAAADAAHAASSFEPGARPEDASCKLGHAELAQARALAALGKSVEARAMASLALDQLQGSLGPSHPDTEAAHLLAKQ